MARYVHTVKLSKEKDSRSKVRPTRKSNRRYAACLVTTTTQTSIKLHNAEQERVQKEIQDLKDAVARLSPAVNMSYQAASALHKKQVSAWFDAFFEEKHRIVRELSGATNILEFAQADASLSNHAEADARKALADRGLTDPKLTDLGRFVSANQRLQQLEQWLSEWQPLEIGSQAVISWHGTEDLAEKTLQGATAGYWRKRGDLVEVCTDIEIRKVVKA